jgi:uncharacterized protein
MIDAACIRSTLTAGTLDFETRFTADESGTFTGYAAKWGEINAHNEIVKPGAFSRSLAEHAKRGIAPPMFWSHHQDEPVGVWTELHEDDTGLAVTGKLVTETTRGREAFALLKAGALTGLSIGFRARKADRDTRGVRVLSDIDLAEISLVALPSAGGARITQVRTYPGLAGFTRAVTALSTSLRRKD